MPHRGESIGAKIKIRTEMAAKIATIYDPDFLEGNDSLYLFPPILDQSWTERVFDNAGVSVAGDVSPQQTELLFKEVSQDDVFRLIAQQLQRVAEEDSYYIPDLFGPSIVDGISKFMDTQQTGHRIISYVEQTL